MSNPFLLIVEGTLTLAELQKFLMEIGGYVEPADGRFSQGNDHLWIYLSEENFSEEVNRLGTLRSFLASESLTFIIVEKTKTKTTTTLIQGFITLITPRWRCVISNLVDTTGRFALPSDFEDDPTLAERFFY